MKRLIALTALLALAGCSSFHLGGVAYCPWGKSCSFQMLEPTTIQVLPPAPPAPSASGVRV